MEGLFQDIRYSFRSLIKSRTFALISIISIALGIGANTAIFSAVQAILLKSLPYRDVSNLVLVWGESRDKWNKSNRNQVSATDIADLRSQNHVFEEITTYTGWTPIMSGSGEAERVPAIQVGDGFFKVMRGKPLLGRVFTPEEQKDGKDFVIVLGYGLWKRRFGGDPQIVGKQILLNSRTYTIAGIMPADFHPLPESLVAPQGEFYRPVAEPYDESQRSARHLRAIARLKPGVTIQQAQTEMNLIAARLMKAHPLTDRDNRFRLVSLTEDTVGGIRPTLLALFAAVIFVLLVVCANVGNLMIGRASAKRKELTVRLALGASRKILIRQILTESMLLSITGGIAGVIFAYAGTHLISAIAAQVDPLLETIAIDFRVLLFALAVSIFAGVLFGAAPAIHLSMFDLQNSLKQGSQSTTSSVSTNRLRNSLVVVEMALTLIMLIGAVLMIQTVVRLRNVNTGFQSRNLLTMSIGLPTKKYPEPADWTKFYLPMVDQLASLPGVQSAAITSVLPMSDNFDGRGIVVEDHPLPNGQEMPVDLYVISAGYLHTMQVPLLQGRDFTTQDRADSHFVALINETMAHELWPNSGPIGKRLVMDSPGEPKWREIVGVVSDVKQYGLDTPVPMQIYLPYPQFPTLFNSIVLRSKSDPSNLIRSVRTEIRRLDSDQAVYRVATMEEWISKSIAVRRFLMALMITFAALALLLAAIGLYGIVSYAVTQRTHEIGIRMAIGAQPGDVIAMILRYGLFLAFLGIFIGCISAIALTRFMIGFLFHVHPTDPWAFSVVSILLLIVAALSCCIPAIRAVRISPVIALRYE